MATLQQPSLVSFTALAFCGVALVNTALAATPPRTSGGHGAMAAGATPPGPISMPHLDLRPPTEIFGGAAKTSSAEFPSSFHRQSIAAFEQSEGEQTRFANFGAKFTSARTSASLEAFAQRVRRQGLPIARLWENKSALVSLGLNQRGKPGVWIVQKVH